MAPVSDRNESFARAERVFVLREVGGQSWSKIMRAEGFGSVGAAQSAYKRYLQRNTAKLPSAEAALAGINERHRTVVSAVFKSLAEAQRAGDHQTVARLAETIIKADAELARRCGLTGPNVQVDVQVSDPAARIAETRRQLMEAIDAEVVEMPRRRELA